MADSNRRESEPLATLDSRQALRAMYHYLAAEFEITKSDDIRDVLSSMTPATDGLPLILQFGKIG